MRLMCDSFLEAVIMDFAWILFVRIIEEDLIELNLDFIDYLYD